MFNIFKKTKQPQYKFCKELIKATDGVLHFDKVLDSHINLINSLLKESNILDDNIYNRLYEEYSEEGRYLAYDICPMLLYCRIPILYSETYDVSGQSILKNWDLIPTLEDLENSIDGRFKIPDQVKADLYDISSRVLGYISGINQEEFLRLALCNYYGNWEQFLKSKTIEKYSELLSIFFMSQCERLYDIADNDHKHLVRNIISRYVESMQNRQD